MVRSTRRFAAQDRANHEKCDEREPLKSSNIPAHKRAPCNPRCVCGPNCKYRSKKRLDLPRSVTWIARPAKPPCGNEPAWPKSTQSSRPVLQQVAGAVIARIPLIGRGGRVVECAGLLNRCTG